MNKSIKDTTVATMEPADELIKKKEVIVPPKAESTEDKGYDVKIIKDYNRKSEVFHIPEPDPYYVYRGLNFSSKKNMMAKLSGKLYDGGGWQICPKEHCLKIGIPERELSPDGTCIVAELILARMPKKHHDEKVAYKQKQANAPMKVVERLIDKGSKTTDVTTGIHKSMKGLQTEEQLRGSFK